MTGYLWYYTRQGYTTFNTMHIATLQEQCDDGMPSNRAPTVLVICI